MNLLSRRPLWDLGRLPKFGLKINLRNGQCFSKGAGAGGRRGNGGVGGHRFASLATASEGPSSDVKATEESSAKDNPSKICILGGGFGGLYTAIKLEALMWPEGKKPMVTLIDQSSNFVFKPMLYELVSGEAQDWEIAPSFIDLLEPYTTSFIEGRVTAVEPNDLTKDGGSSRGGTVLLDNGSTVEYDWLVLALGAETNTRNVPGVKDFAIPFNSFEDAEKIRNVLDNMDASDDCTRVVVVGGGYAGVELAAVVAEKIAKKSGVVTLVTDLNQILVMSPDLQRESAMEVLNEAGVEVRTGFFVERINRRTGMNGVEVLLTPASAPGSMTETLEASVALWTAGSSPATRNKAVESTIPFPRNKFGAMLTEPTLRVVNHSRVFALGDTSSQESDIPTFPATAQVAFQQADFVAWNLWASINGRQLLSFRYQHLGDMMSLGSRKAAVALPFGLPDAVNQSPLKPIMDVVGVKLGSSPSERVTIEGPFGGLLRRATYWYRQPTNEHRARVGASWVQKGLSDASKWIRETSKS